MAQGSRTVSAEADEVFMAIFDTLNSFQFRKY